MTTYDGPTRQGRAEPPITAERSPEQAAFSALASDSSAIPFQVDNTTPADFEDFYARHRDTVAQTLALGFNNVELGYEAADEAMARAFRNWSKVAHYDNPEGWVFRVGLNWGRSWLRRRASSLVKGPPLVDGRANTIDQIAADLDLQAALAKLNWDHRIVVVLRFHRDYSVPQIAATLDIAEGTVKSRLHRATKQLAGHLTTNLANNDAGDNT